MLHSHGNACVRLLLRNSYIYVARIFFPSECELAIPLLLLEHLQPDAPNPLQTPPLTRSGNGRTMSVVREKHGTMYPSCEAAGAGSSGSPRGCGRR